MSAALVFDEIDAGVGGATGDRRRRAYRPAGASGQVVCVTHLAQLATLGRSALRAGEDASEQHATTISVREITGAEAREIEIARMLSGETHDVALKHARTLFKKAR